MPPILAGSSEVEMELIAVLGFVLAIVVFTYQLRRDQITDRDRRIKDEKREMTIKTMIAELRQLNGSSSSADTDSDGHELS